jgi:hypothetical protein
MLKAVLFYTDESEGPANWPKQVIEFDDDTGGPLILNPGELMAIRTGAAMDAAGTWQLGVNVDWTEIDNLAA